MPESYSKRLRLVNYSLIVLIIAVALGLLRNVINISVLEKTQPEFANTTKDKDISFKKKDIMSYAPILEKNPFGRPQKLIPLTSELKNQRTTSPEDLILIGTAIGDKNLSYAIFENKSLADSQKQEIFPLGGHVYDYGTLTSIEKEWVELTQGAVRYKIYLIEPQIKEIQTGNSAASHSSFAKKITEKQYLLNQQKVQQALNNPEQILTEARLLPNIEDGKQNGFKVLEVKPGGIYEGLGLRNGDILLRVNDLEISNPEVAMQAMYALKGMSTVSLDIIRNGERTTMSYQIR